MSLLKMLFTGLSTALLLLFLCPSGYSQNDQTPSDTNCTSAAAAKLFQSTAYDGLVSALDYEAVAGFQQPAADAAKIIYDVNLRLFEEFGFKTGKDIAKKVKDAVLLVDPYKLQVQFFNLVTAIGGYLSEKGFLNCKNAIATANDYVKFEETRFGDSDKHKLESYVQAIVLSLDDLLNSLGYSMAEDEQGIQRLADLFYEAYKNFHY